MLKSVITVIVVENDILHAKLIEKGLILSGISEKIIIFRNGREVLDFLFGQGSGRIMDDNLYVIFLDIDIPVIDGLAVLERIKSDRHLQPIPVFMLSDDNNERVVEKCHKLGCNAYIVKPKNNDNFVEKIKNFGLFMKIASIPAIDGIDSE